ncbi:glycosyl transferase family 90-domain-containing protein [Phaeosphaeria sp. MPI-PUGE-AT-0046c]|nr:glycosyl transferase family 90-domain-containing protein [Phaeosphaeria sp. MPI-PUGE-AT-0046c]
MVLLLRSRLRMVLVSCFIFVISFLLLTCHDLFDEEGAVTARPLLDRLDLTEKQCRDAFPQYFTELDANLARPAFKFSKSDPDYQGLVQGRIINNTLYVLTTSPTSIAQTLHQRTSTLSQIHRALLTSPVQLPDIYFAFAVNDVPKTHAWNYARPNKDLHDDANIWLMPPFSSWSWPTKTLGDPSSILSRIEDIETSTAFTDKIDRAIWRGTPWFNPLGQPNLRKDLISATRGQEEWADVAALNGSNALAIEDFCRYRYVIYTEGVTYSGRLPYHQACGSVLITAPLTWRTTSALLMKPIWAAELMGAEESQKAKKGALKMVTRFEDANAIYVKPDFSDLNKLIGFLRDRVDVAETIARNQRDMVVTQGYLSSAAETCYWRSLIRAWGKSVVVNEPEWADLKGEKYETWLLKEVSTSRTGARGKITAL